MSLIKWVYLYFDLWPFINHCVETVASLPLYEGFVVPTLSWSCAYLILGIASKVVLLDQEQYEIHWHCIILHPTAVSPWWSNTALCVGCVVSYRAVTFSWRTWILKDADKHIDLLEKKLSCPLVECWPDSLLVWINGSPLWSRAVPRGSMCTCLLVLNIIVLWSQGLPTQIVIQFHFPCLTNMTHPGASPLHWWEEQADCLFAF